MCSEYLKGLFWILQYYQDDCASWSWHYNFMCSPTLKDLVNYLDKCKNKIAIKLIDDEPLSPHHQLISILPKDSIKNIESLSHIIKDYDFLFPQTFKLNSYYKIFEHQCLPYLPHIDYHMIKHINI